MTVDEYIELHIDAEPAHLRRLYRQTHLERLYPRMCTDHTQGRLLAMLTTMIRPRRIIELGTFTGYSTLCMAEAMPAECMIDTVEIDAEYADDIRATFDNAGFGDRITLHTGDALELLPDLLASNTYDMAFVDANKRHYPLYYDLLRKAMKPGSYILIDNTLWDNKVTDTSAHDPQTEGAKTLNDIVATDNGVSKIIIPVRDGLTVVHIEA